MTVPVRTSEIPLDARERRMIGAGLLVLIVSLGGAAAAFFALWQRKEARATQRRTRAASRSKGTSRAAAASRTTPRPDGGDDLKVIEGIGPRTEEALNEAGIHTYAQLAKLAPDRLETIMRDAGTLVARRETWPDQARLAAAGDWQALTSLQDQLKAAPSG